MSAGPVRFCDGLAFIKLHDGKEAIIDREDAEMVSAHKWYSNNVMGHVCAYRHISGRRVVYMHRQIMSAPDGLEVDHINGNALDNRKKNLRLATRAQNGWNSKKRSDNSSGYKGVAYSKASKKWRAYISVEGRQIHLGLFETPEDAHKARSEKARVYHGEFARS